MTSTLHARRPFVIRPISTVGWRQQEGDRRATHGTATANWIYIKRLAGEDVRGSLDYCHRDDLVAAGIATPPKAPRWAEEPGRVWREIDAIMDGRAPDAIRAWHIVMSLPTDASQKGWREMVQSYARESIAARGIIADWAIHALRDGDGAWLVRPHVHLLMTTNAWKHGDRQGAIMPSWCGAAARSRLEAGWLDRLPATMRIAATEAYRCGQYVPARLPLPLKKLRAANLSRKP